MLIAALFATTGSAAGAVAAGIGDPRPEAVRTLAQDGRGATFQVTPGAARFEDVNVGGAAYSRVSVAGGVVVETPGRPALPTLSLHVAVPEGMSPRMRVVAEEWEDHAGPPPVPVAQQRFVSDDPSTGPASEFRTDPDPAVYRGGALYPVDAAVLGSGALVGEWWVVPVHVHPVRWDSRAGAYKVLRTMSVRVDFVPASDRELAGRPVTRPGPQARAWDRVQHGLVRNYEAARAFPWRPRPGSVGALPRGGALPAGRSLAANPEWKLMVAQTGWVSVSYATLASSGFPSNIDIANVRVEERGYDDAADAPTVTPIPVVARDNNGNLKFDAGDAVTFYARSIRDRFGLGNIELRYSDVNVYWLTWGSTPAATPGTVSGVIPGSATTPVSFRDVIRLEEDHVAMTAPNNSLTSPPEAIEYLFWTDGQEGDQFDTPIPFVNPDTAQPFRIRARYQGFNVSGVIHRFDVFFRGSSGVKDTLAAGYEFQDQEVWLLDTGFTIPGSHIGAGTNSYQHVGVHKAGFGSPPLDGSDADLDVVEVTYSRLYTAQNNSLRFTSGASGAVFELHVGGFTGSVAPSVEVLDITDPLGPISVSGVTVSPTGGGKYEAVFRTDATAGERKFVAVVPGAETALSGIGVIADVGSNLRQPGAFDNTKIARSILIAPQPFLVEANRLATYRRGQGYVVEVADVADVYDEFNGGIKSARAIRRYLRHAYLTWSPRLMYALLAGDA
ncbi:MAG TPA: C25 family cysteine peptidase, partial [Candidatus Limnocylindrales bacterium]|nr:C25 family cysteine peptidase [Candidatus Limnocylindrales bacterium]